MHWFVIELLISDKDAQEIFNRHLKEYFASKEIKLCLCNVKITQLVVALTPQYSAPILSSQHVASLPLLIICCTGGLPARQIQREHQEKGGKGPRRVPCHRRPQWFSDGSTPVAEERHQQAGFWHRPYQGGAVGILLGQPHRPAEDEERANGRSILVRFHRLRCPVPWCCPAFPWAGQKIKKTPS